MRKCVSPPILLPFIAKALRFLTVDAIYKAKSGHIGMPLGMAEVATVLWYFFLKQAPQAPFWENRDRLIWSNGHGCMLLYALLHLSGYDYSIQDLQSFRQLHSKTTGHPEIREGVDMNTGPIGQGLASAIGFALAERTLAARFNRPYLPLVSHYTYVFAGDGCLMEGVSHEACSLAGVLKLNRLIVFWDNNHVSIDGHVEGWFNENVEQRFTSYGWRVLSIDGHNMEAIYRAIQIARSSDRPVLINCRTMIGQGSAFQNHPAAHRNPLSAEDIAAMRQALDWPYLPFKIPLSLSYPWKKHSLRRGEHELLQWRSIVRDYAHLYPALMKAYQAQIQAIQPQKLSLALLKQQPYSASSRTWSQQIASSYAAVFPQLLGGSADLSVSNGTIWHGASPVHQNTKGNYIHYGVREFGMVSIMNGLAAHGGFIPYGGTFLVFSDYAKSAIRLAALMHVKMILVLTHDSVFAGEDGPTHQPIEQLDALRSIPYVAVWRPCDWCETVVAWHQALLYQNPSCLILSKQEIVSLASQSKMTPSQRLEMIQKGGYLYWQTPNQDRVDLVVCASGAEVIQAILAAQKLSQYSIHVYSVPCLEKFKKNMPKMLQSSIKKMVIEAGTSYLWHLVPPCDYIRISTFGLSAPGEDVYTHFHFDVLSLSQSMLKWINKAL